MQLVPTSVKQWLGMAPKGRPPNPAPSLPGGTPSPETRAEPMIPMGAEPPTGHYTDIPIATLGAWSVERIQAALNGHQMGNFQQSALLAEAMVGDDRIQSALNGRIKGVTMRHLTARRSKRDRKRRVLRAVERAWKKVFTDELMDQFFMWSTILGFALCEVQWTAVNDEDFGTIWMPYLKVWHPSFVWYDIAARQYVAITQEGNVYIDEADPHWFLFTPWGRYRGWLRGAVRSCSPPWLIRQYARRDWARYTEVHGLPIKLIDAPAQSNAPDKARMFAQVRAMNSQTTILLPQQTPGADGSKWDVRLLEAKDESWAAFPGLIKDCDMAIQLSIRGTNLTSEIQGGSYAAAQVHSDEDSSYANSDCRKLCSEATRLFKLFCAYNFGDADLCPSLSLEAPDKQDKLALAQAQQAVGQTCVALIDKGVPVDIAAWFKDFKIPVLGDDDEPLELEPPEQDDEPADGDEEVGAEAFADLRMVQFLERYEQQQAA